MDSNHSFPSQSQRRINRTLTQKYDINALKALQKLEEVVLEQVEAIYEVPSEFDIIAIYNRKEDEREAKLVGPPFPCTPPAYHNAE